MGLSVPYGQCLRLCQFRRSLLRCFYEFEFLINGRIAMTMFTVAGCVDLVIEMVVWVISRSVPDILDNRLLPDIVTLANM
jgi:hypothetical protein